MEPTPSPNERELADLAALADGSLAPERRSEVEARVAADPELRGLVGNLGAFRDRIVDAIDWTFLGV